MTITLNHDYEEHEHEELLHRFIRELQEHVNLLHADDDGQLQQTAQVLAQKRGCRR